MRIEVKIEDPADFDEVEIIEIPVAVGDTVAAGDVLLEIATDKANMTVEAPAAGAIVEILVSQDDIVRSDAVLVVLEV
jgi:pyruvate dehydrogenase E2 component (dihydrolipoamide acetyltransferase)